MAPPPPSFSSFPDIAPNPPPPSFSSFPSAQRPPAPAPQPEDKDSDRPSKRARASDFLNEVKSEIQASGSHLEKRSVKREGSGARADRGEDESRERKSSKGEGKGKGKEREHRRSKEKRKEVVQERDSDYGKRDKPWKLVAIEAEDAPAPSTPPLPTSAEPRMFYADRKGDEYNMRYGGLHKGDIPRYRRLGAGRIVGLNSGLRITKESAHSGRGLEVGPHTTYRTPRYTDPRSAHFTSDKHFKRITIAARRAPAVLGESADPYLESASEDPFLASASDFTRFVAFEPEQSLPEKLAQLEFEEGQDYRSIAGLVKPSDLDAASDEEGDDGLFGGLGVLGGESRDEYLKRRNIEMDRALRDAPTNVDRWLEFVEYQDEVSLSSFVGSSAKRALSKAERTSTSEIKLAILDRALAVPGNQGSEKLLLAYLRAAAEVWDPKKVLYRWGETLRSHPGLTGLWIEYVSWRQTSWANFGVREVVDVFVDSFKVLLGAAEKEQIGSSGREVLEGNAIYLFLRCCLMLRQAGFAERALAAFQTIIELNFFRPDDLALPAPNEPENNWRTRVFDRLEMFWDSEVTRVGESNAKGWKHSSDTPELSNPIPTPTTASALEDDANPFARWADTERRTADSQPRPARTTDPGVDDDIDPFRVVLFDDVRDFLFIVHSPDSRLQLVYAFLTFIGLPFVPPDYPTSTPFSTDTFIHSELVERPKLREKFWPKLELGAIPFDTVAGEAMEPERRSALKDPFDTPFHATPVSVDLFFGTKPKWFLTLAKEDLEHVDVDFARNIFTLLRPVVSDTFFTLAFFSYEACQSPKAAVKLAKQVLRDNRQNLALWDGYARIERQRGKIDEARAVYVTALSMYRTFASSDQIDGPLLWRAWAEMEWEEGRPMLALKVLVAAAVASADDVDLSTLAKVDPDVRPPPAQILRARLYYTTELEASFQLNVSQATLRNRNHVAQSSSLFEYLTQGLASATEVLERHLFRLECAAGLGSSEHEEAFMLYVKLLYRHASARVGYKPGQLRDVLERAIKEYPNNSLFLSVFYHNELRMKIQNRVRRSLEEFVLTEKGATSEGWLFAIFAELHLDARSHSVWGVRNLFDRAVDNPRTRPSASLWTLYIDFEIRNGDLGRAKALVYRAIRELPWCKDLYLKPFSMPLRGVYRSNELREMHQLLLEKGLRVRVEIDDFVEGWSSEVEMEDGESDMEEDAPVVSEVAELLEERARLMPY